MPSCCCITFEIIAGVFAVLVIAGGMIPPDPMQNPTCRTCVRHLGSTIARVHLANARTENPAPLRETLKSEYESECAFHTFQGGRFCTENVKNVDDMNITEEDIYASPAAICRRMGLCKGKGIMRPGSTFTAGMRSMLKSQMKKWESVTKGRGFTLFTIAMYSFFFENLETVEDVSFLSSLCEHGMKKLYEKNLV